MADCQIYGDWPGGHHLTNAVLHAATAVLLFLVLLHLTGDFWPSTLVAAIFAFHPLHVESVAWVSERKDVLSGLCFMLTLAAYIHYATNPFSTRRYLLVVALMAFGLLAKPMLVTLPCVLLLLDCWPLNRFRLFDSSIQGQPWNKHDGYSTLIVEKLPLLALSAAACWLTIWAQRDSGAIETLDRLPLTARLSNVVVAYATYLRQSFVPIDLAAYYPSLPTRLAAGNVIGAISLLTVISVAAYRWRHKHPYLLVGWCWFLGMLVPVIGIVQVGSQATADRYMYLPQIGLCIALAWGIAGLARQRHWNARACGAASVLLIAALMACSWRQASYWSGSEALWSRALACTTQNSFRAGTLCVLRRSPC